jgi:copper chaperone CopZ
MSSCCTPGGSRSTGTARTATAEGTTTVHTVAGMTCGHCEATLTEAVDEAGYELTGRAV